MTLEICRICGSNENLKHVFREGSDDLLDQIRLCANIQINELDCLPKHVCIVCEQGLAFSYRLRKRGEETEKKLRQVLFADIKDEPKPEYCLDDESNKEDDCEALIEESCTEELWLKEEDSGGQFDASEDLIYKADDTDEDTLQVIPEEDYVESEQSVKLANECYTETGEILESVDIEPVQVDFMELIYDEKAESEIEIKPKVSKLKFDCAMDDSYKHHTDMSLSLNTYNDKSSFLKDTKRFHCELCPKTFRTVSHLNVHKKSHSKEKSYSCEICGRKMRYQGNLRVHMRTVHKQLTPEYLEKSAHIIDPSKSLLLDQCLDSMSNECKAITTVFLLDRCKVFKCTVCGKLSNFKATHIAHCRIHLNEKPFHCRSCDKSFRQLATLKEHEVIHSGTRPYKCSTCSRSFLQKSALAKHKFWHTGRRPFECSICGTTFRNQGALRTHERIHTGEKPYSCDICTQKFREKRQVERHKKKYHHSREDRSGEKTSPKSVLYHCTWKNCRQSFVLRPNLVSHMQRHLNPHHSGDTFKCGDCSKEFFKPIHVWQHQKLYKGTCVSGMRGKELFKAAPIKYSICWICSKIFASAVALARHRRVHLSLRQYKCIKCEMRFRHRYSLNLHIRKHAVSQIEIVPVYERYFSKIEDEVQLKEEEENNIEGLYCPHCLERVPSAELLENHIFSYHDNV